MWGRSMGAATALLHAYRDPEVRALVLDSPFTSLPQLMKEMAAKRSSIVQVPFAVDTMLMLLQGSIKERADFDIHDVNPLNHILKSNIPALFATGDADDFISPEHCQTLHDAYPGEKLYLSFEGDHHSSRPEWFHRLVRDFLKQNFINAKEPPVNPDGTKVERRELNLHSNSPTSNSADDGGVWASVALMFGPVDSKGGGARVCGW